MPAASARRRTQAARRKPVPRAKANRPEITVEDLESFNDSINIMIYGDSGVGKTPLAAQAPNAVILSTEKGAISAKRFGSKAKLIRATNWELIEAAIEHLEKNPEAFDWCIVDSVTKMQQLLIRHLLEVNVAEGKNKADLDVPQVQDHQKWQNMFKRFIDRLVDMEINCIFIATAMHKEDAEGDDLVLPHIQGKDYEICQYVCAQMDTILCLKVHDDPDENGNPIWKLLSRATYPYFAKDRYDALPTLMIDPSMPDIIERIESSGPDDDGNPAVKKRRARRAAADVDEEDDTDEIEGNLDEEDDEEPEPAPRRRKPASRLPRKVAPESDDDEEDELEEPEPDEDEEGPPIRRTPKGKSPRAAATRRKTPRRKPKPEPEPNPDEDDDLDFEDDDIDFEDDE